MSDATATPDVSVTDIFLEFLVIGATSFGNIVPYLRNGLVVKRRWIDDNGFIELISISETLPGLNATNIAVFLATGCVASRDQPPRSSVSACLVRW